MKKRILSGIAVGIAAALTLTACSGGAATPAHDDTLKIGTMTKPSSLDPIDAIGGALPYFQAVYDTLLRKAPDGSYQPMLATEWEYNDDRTVMTLTLRDDVTFDDGTPFDAAAVKANMDRFRDGGGANAKQLLDAEIAVVDDTHVTVSFPEPNPGLEFSLSNSAGLMANPTKFAEEDALVTTPDGTGPYTLNTDETAIGTTWVFDQRDDYWGEESDFSTVSISAFDNENAIVNGLKTGQIDSALVQTADQQIAAEADPTLVTHDVNFDFQGVLLFDRDGAVTPALAEPKVRQALNYAIDRETLLQVVRDGRGEITSQIWGVDTQGYEEKLDTYYDYDPEKAKELLAEAGYADGFELSLPRMTALTTDNIVSALSTDLGAVGITVNWVDNDGADALQRIFYNREFSGMVMNMGQSADDWDVYSTMLAPGTFNFFGTTDETVQKIGAEVRVLPSNETADLYKELNEHIVEEAWFLPFYRMTYKLINVPGIVVEPQAGQAEASIYNYSLAD